MASFLLILDDYVRLFSLFVLISRLCTNDM